jgi:hypothetical protein
LATASLRCPPAPLLEEERHIENQALVAQLVNPLLLDWAPPHAGLATCDQPVDARDVEVGQRAEQRLGGDEANRARHGAQQVSSMNEAPVLDRHSCPYMCGESSMQRLVSLVTEIAAGEGLNIRPSKTLVMGDGHRQRLAGIVINEKPNLDRPAYDMLRATLRDASLNGLQAANRVGHDRFGEHLTGRVAWVVSLNPGRAQAAAAACQRPRATPRRLTKHPPERRFRVQTTRLTAKAKGSIFGPGPAVESYDWRPVV